MVVNIQVLRAFAALMVIFVHCAILVAPIGVPAFTVEAFSSGVDLFFVVSGFIITHTTRHHASTPRSFILSRISRLVPLYWLLTILTFGIALVFPDFLGGTKAVFSYLIKSLLFIPYLRDDGSPRPILFLGWSLNYEMFFYFIFAMSLFVQSRTQRAAAIIASITGLVAIGSISHGPWTPTTFWTSPVMMEFAAGVALGTAYNRLPASRRAALSGLALLPFCEALLISSSWLLPKAATFVRTPASFGILLCALLMERGGLTIKSRWLILLGDASYALYLTHPFVAQGISKLAIDFHILNSATSIPLVLSIYALACLVAVFVFRYVERPLTQMTRRALGVDRTLALAGGL